MAYIPSTSHITLLATLRRERMLPLPGEVLIQPGQHVEASDVVAMVDRPESHRLVDVARQLGVSKEKAAGFMVKQEGDPVKKGEALAQRKTLFGMQSIPSPVDGRLVLYGEGRALIAALSRVEVRAGFPGTIVNVFGGNGVVVETTGALIEGIWGNGREDFSALRMVSPGPAEPLQSDQLDLSLRGAVIAASVFADMGVLKTLNEVGVRGLMVGSAPTELLPALQKQTYPVLVVDRFGGQGFSDVAFKLLNGSSGREVWVNAQVRDRFANAQPEAIIPLPSPDLAPPPPAEGEALAEGKRVRVVRGTDTGRIGTVLGLSDRLVSLPSGIRTYVAAVVLDETRGARPTVTVPFANLEVLE